MTQPSSENLASELDKADLPEMAKKAREDYYHDFLSPLATPCIQLANDIAAAATPAALALRARHLQGEFDATKEESDAWAKSDEAQQIFLDLAKGK